MKPGSPPAASGPPPDAHRGARPGAAPVPQRLSPERRRDFLFLITSRVSTRLGDGFLRILSVLLVAEKSRDPMIAGLVLVFRYVCEILINAVSGPIIDRLRIRTSLMASDLARTVLAALLVGAVLGGFPYPVFLALSFLGDFVFIFFKPAADKVVKVTFPVEEGTKVLSQIDAANHASNIGGFMLASLLAGWLGPSLPVVLGPIFFMVSFLLVVRLRLPGEAAIDYGREKKKSYWARQREGLGYTWASPPLRLLLLGRSLVAVARGSFTVLSVVYLAGLAKGLASYGYFESAQSAGKVLVTALVIPLFFAHRSTFLLTGLAEVAIGLSFFSFNLVDDVLLACVVGVAIGVGQAAEAVGIDAILNRYADARIQGRAKSTTSFGSRLSGLAAMGLVYLLVNTFHVQPGSLFAWLGIFPILGGAVFLLGWLSERGSLAQVEFLQGPATATLRVVAGDAGEPAAVVGRDPVTLGRSRRANFVLHDDAVSRFHAVVRRERFGWVIEDLESSNGVLVNGVQVDKAELGSGDEVTLGRTRLRFEVATDESARRRDAAGGA